MAKPRPATDRPLTLSILERFELASLPLDFRQSTDELERAVRANLERIFNAVQPPVEVPEDSLLAKSIFQFGIPDPASLSIQNPDHQRNLVLWMQEAIRNYEPRLKNPVVTLDAKDTNKERTLKFHVTATLRSDPLPQAISFSTDLDVQKGEFRVEGETLAG